MGPSFGKRRAQVLTGVRHLDLRDLFGRPGSDHHPAAFPAFRAEIDDVVRRLDHVEIVLDDEQRVARLEQFPEGREQLRDVVEMQAGRRLIENIEQPFAAMRRQMRGNCGVVWLTGLSAAGKSTIARELEKRLLARGVALR